MIKKGRIERTFRFLTAVTIILLGTSIISEGSLKATEYRDNPEEYNDEKIHEVIGEEGNEKTEEIEEGSLEEDTNTISGNTEEIGISLMSFNVQNEGSYTPRTKQITGHNSAEYDDGEFRGTLERYVMSGSPADTKSVTGHPTSSYNKDGYTGTLTQYVESGLPSDTKSVTGQPSSSYNKDGYVGTLTRYVASGSPADTKTVTNQPSSSYNSGGYTGTLTRYVHSGSDSQSKYVEGQTSANYSDSSGYTGTLTEYVYSGSYTPSHTKNVTGQTSQYYNSGGYTGTLTQYLYSGGYTPSDTKYVTGQTSSYYSSGGYSGSLSSYTATITPADSIYVSELFRHVTRQVNTYRYNSYSGTWDTVSVNSSPSAPSTKSYNSGGYSGTLSKSGGGLIYDSGGYPTHHASAGATYTWTREWEAFYAGTVTKPAVTATRYQGYVTRPASDTSVYRYRGDVTRPESDTRVYRYRGTVTTPDTRVYRYQGDVTKPDTREYAYEGNVTRPDTRVYKYEGNVSKPDTRVYGYRGTVYEIDKDAPEITIVTDGDSNPSVSHSTVVNVSDEYTGVELSQYQWTTSPEFPNGGTWTSFTSGETICIDEGSGGYYLHIIAVDKEGNISQSTSKEFVLETLPPKAPELEVDETNFTNRGVVVTIHFENELNTLEYKVGNGEWLKYTKPIGVEENSTIYARETSLTGLESDVSELVVSNIDKVEPKMSIKGNLTEYTREEYIALTVNVEDEISGIKEVTLPDGTKSREEEVTYNVRENGLYSFKVEDNAGNIYEETITVSNIDRQNPIVTIEGNPTEYTEDDEVEITIKVTDKGSGVRGIILPSGEDVEGDTATIKVNKNGEYKIVAEDNVGNKEEFTIIVDKMMIEYFFYIHDSKGQPLQGAEFVLMRDGEDYATATSDENGLVHFGKVPPTGKYTIRQIKAPDGFIVDPDEKDVDVGDESDPIEIINHPRGEELPATGTIDSVIQAGIVFTVGMMSIRMGNKKKRYRNTL